MYIIGIDRANLSREEPKSFKIAIANMHGEIKVALSDASEDLLQKIINKPTLTDPAVWSMKEFKLIEHLTSREIIILKDYHIKRLGMRTNLDELTPQGLYCRDFRCMKNKRQVSSDDVARYEAPPFVVYTKENGQLDPWLSSLCYNTLLLSKLKYYKLEEE